MDVDEVEEFLAHYGVKGMKWGVRREQLRAANAQVTEAKAALKSAKEARSEGRKSVAVGAAKRAAVATAVVGGAAAAAAILRKSGGKPSSAISGVGKAASSASANSGKVGKKWLTDGNHGIDLFSSPYSKISRSQSPLLDLATKVAKK